MTTPTNDSHQLLMDKAYNMIDRNGDGDINSYADMMEYLQSDDTTESIQMLDAVVLGNMNYQVENGGWEQWVDNGYCVAYPLLISALERIGSDYAKSTIAMVETVGERLSDDVLDGTAKSQGCMGDYLNDEYSEREETCTECDGFGVIETEEWNDETEECDTTTEDCYECGGSGSICIDKDLDFGNLSNRYYDYNIEFMAELQNYFSNSN